jgi:hypothetical protein
MCTAFSFFALHTFKILYNNDPRRHSYLLFARIFCYSTSVFIFIIGVADALYKEMYAYYLICLVVACVVGYVPILINTLRITRASSLLRVNSRRIDKMLRNVKLLVFGAGFVVLAAGVFQVFVAVRVLTGLQQLDIGNRRTVGHAVFLAMQSCAVLLAVNYCRGLLQDLSSSAPADGQPRFREVEGNLTVTDIREKSAFTTDSNSYRENMREQSFSQGPDYYENESREPSSSINSVSYTAMR